MNGAYHAALVSLLVWAYVVAVLCVVVVTLDALAQRRSRRDE